MMQLIGLFREENCQITFASTEAISEKVFNLKSENISVENIFLNDSSFDAFIKKLNPSIVLFDRYITEEQFGWRVSEHCPNALKILDTEDLHFLRKAREEAVKNGEPITAANLFSETAKRELASILRCDLSLIISEYELELLQNTFKISPKILYYLPFLVETVSEEKSFPSFKERYNFLAIGNLLHAPNVDSVLQLKEIWPEIKKQVPNAELHIYGAYAPQQIQQLHHTKEGFIIKGWADDVANVMENYRVQLAPLRFGAGLKGKLLDAMRFGLPSVTTEVGAEGMHCELQFGGTITNSKEDFINASVKLYSEEKIWKEAQQSGFEIIKNRFQKSLFSEDFKKHIRQFSENLKKHRKQNFLGQIIQHQTLQSTKYLSKWIEAKNNPNASNVCFEKSDEVRKEYRE